MHYGYAAPEGEHRPSYDKTKATKVGLSSMIIYMSLLILKFIYIASV